MPLGQLYIVSAPSGAGKTSLVKALLDQMSDIGVSVSHTTRAPRPGEENGVNYHFVSVEQFQQMIAAEAFIEHAQVFDNFYGTSKAAVEANLQAGQDVILEIDWQGAQQVRRLWPNSIGIFILPPSLPELASRLNGRGQDSADVIAKRMAQAQSEMIHYDEYDFILINDQFEHCLLQFVAIITAQRLTLSRQTAQNAALLQDLVASNTEFL